MLWLKLKIDGGIILHFRVRGYKPCDKAKPDEWCTIDLVLESDNIDYKLYDDESLEVAEVKWLEESIENAINRVGDNPMRLGPIEPYMLFDVYSNYPYGNEKIPFMVWKIILWDGGIPTESTINLAIFEEEMSELLLYLKYARGELKEDDSAIKEGISKGFLYGREKTVADCSTEYIAKSNVINNNANPDNNYIFCKVSFGDNHVLYTYLANELYKEGDFVLAPAGKGNTESVVEIKEVRICTDEDAPYPIEKTKHIIRQLTNDEVDRFLGSGETPTREFTIYNEEYATLHGNIDEGCLHLVSNVYGEEYDSEKFYDFSAEDTERLFSIIGFTEFVEKCKTNDIGWMEKFLENNEIKPKTCCF